MQVNRQYAIWRMRAVLEDSKLPIVMIELIAQYDSDWVASALAEMRASGWPVAIMSPNHPEFAYRIAAAQFVYRSGAASPAKIIWAFADVGHIFSIDGHRLATWLDEVCRAGNSRELMQAIRSSFERVSTQALKSACLRADYSHKN